MKEKVLDTLQDLLAMESDLHCDMSTIIRYTRRRLEAVGMRVKQVGPERYPALLATYGKNGMLFSGHLDTVPLGSNWAMFQGEIDGNRIYGRGTTDMKGACAAMIEAAGDLVKEDVPFSICLTTDEEEQMEGVTALVKEDVVRKAKGVLIMEPTELAPAYREKGVYRFRLTTRGRAAHASQPWLGDDAVLKMHYCLGRLLDLAEISSQRSTGMTMCFSTIQGGNKNNVVSDHCTVEVDVRYPSTQTTNDIEDIIVNRLRGEVYEMDVEYTIGAFESDPGSEISRVLSDFLGTDPIVVPYATEAPHFAAVNPHVYICGPGDPKLAHIIDEYVEIQELEEAHDLIVHLAKYVQG
ncbi:MAG: M20 family metallopeptidase [Methanomassiliicoccus sp.]|jgi:acetylornithine deacetylase/succinyl-diaminopimelate desuccinylase-like protein|nr:M20 family metallopeptidase [Methanomassiliicoccus sp.]